MKKLSFAFLLFVLCSSYLEAPNLELPGECNTAHYSQYDITVFLPLKGLTHDCSPKICFSLFMIKISCLMCIMFVFVTVQHQNALKYKNSNSYFICKYKHCLQRYISGGVPCAETG